MTHTSTEQLEPRYADVVHHANVHPSLSYVARKTGLGYQETTRLLELALARGDLASGDYAGRNLDLYVADREKALTQEVEQLRARVQELEASQAQRVPLSDEQIEDLPVWKHFVGMLPAHWIEIARAIEAAHGITQEKRHGK
jgi:hypothetical protein